MWRAIRSDGASVVLCDAEEKCGERLGVGGIVRVRGAFASSEDPAAVECRKFGIAQEQS
jgi:hypothetical protein